MSTSFHKVNNNAASVLASGIDDNDLALSVSSGDGAEFDSVLQYLTLGRDENYAGEIVEASSRSTDAFTLTARGADGTTATSHDAGARVECLVVAAHLTEIQDAINAIENGTVFLAQVKLGDDTGKLIFGTDSDIQFVYDETTDDRLEITDAAGNVLGYWKDLGTTGLLGVTGRFEAPQIGISADTDLLTLTANALALAGVLTGTHTDAGTNDVVTLLALYHMSSGTPAAGLGAKIILGAEDANSTATGAIELQGYLTDVTDGSEDGAFKLRLMTAGSMADALTIALNSLSFHDDTDSTAIFGRCRLASATSDRAQFAHRDRSASNQYALSHLAGGDLHVNGTTTIAFQINASTKVTLTATDLAVGSAATDTMTLTSRLLVRTVTDAGPMTATGGTQREIVWNTSDSKLYVCTVTHVSAATWVALH